MRRSVLRRLSASVVGFAMLSATAGWASPPEPAYPPGGDIPQHFEVADRSFDFDRREVEIPMRDGVRLHTVILVPRGGARMPILLTRTPYDADRATSRQDSPRLVAVVPGGDDVVAVSGYVRVFQDVRGKYGSEGEYVMNRPLRGPLNPTAVDHSTDAWDTIDWLVRNVPESNGRVGILGTSYPGFLALMALVDPHPALRAAVPINPMVDCWIGDDWFHYGAFRQAMMLYVYEQTATQDNDSKFWSGHHDDYQRFLEAGSAGALGHAMGMDQLPFWRRVVEHPAYDDFWRLQAVDRILAGRPLAVPTLHVGGLWDQEDIYGAPAVYAAMEEQDARNDRNFLVLGPWRHGGSNGDGRELGVIHFDGDTGLHFRREILQPFLDRYLKEGGPAAAIPPVVAYQTGADRWRSYDSWPPSCAAGCAPGARNLYLRSGFRLAFAPDPPAQAGGDSYVSDPAKPVPYRQRPIRPLWAKDSTWGRWLVDDQRFASDRTDVLVYVSELLTAPVTVSGQPVANLFATTTGSDADWVVKLVDLYPDEVPEQPELGGYQLGVAMDILRGRYRESTSQPTPIPPGEVQRYRLPLPTVHHVFRPGHRILVQIQSSWFPLYDRNPQSFVGNVFLAPPEAYTKATHTVLRGGQTASFLELPVVEER